jgi:hypothetical protein
LNQASILYPVAAMTGLVCVVMALLLRERIAEMKARRIHPQQLPSSSQMSATLQHTRAADNYKNLFEMPVLFYVLCLALFATQMAGGGFVLAAWAYVALRVLHSSIHVGYNRIMHRFSVFALSSALLLAMWIAFVVQLAQRA